MNTVTTETRPMSRAAATRAVRASLTWDAGPPSEERACARSEAQFWIRHHLNDRAEFLRIIEALDRGPVDFLAEMQRTAPFKDEPAGRVSLALFERVLFGAASGGFKGPYGREFMATIAAASPYARSAH